MAGGRAGIADLRGPRLLNFDPTELKAALANEARALGFDCIGITASGTIENAGKHFLEFIASGGHGDMD